MSLTACLTSTVRDPLPRSRMRTVRRLIRTRSGVGETTPSRRGPATRNLALHELFGAESAWNRQQPIGRR